MDRLWGAFLAIPAERLRVLKGGERINISGRELEVAYTPGHASHHVSYYDPGSRVAFVGDTAGIRRGSGAFVLPPTPPPDIDLEAWRESERRILAWNPETLFVTHFGPFHGARVHFQELFARLDAWNGVVRRLLADQSLTDEDRERQFVAEALHELRRTVGETEAARYSRAGRLDYSWQGLARYWRKKGN
jgi:glyoxylase-like metal-dependent hydrolase (beta-lactamase superfamily II)